MLDKKGMTHYEVDIKREAVRIFLEEHQTSATIAQKHVFTWVYHPSVPNPDYLAPKFLKLVSRLQSFEKGFLRIWIYLALGSYEI